jgi:hypothetical protein
VADTITIKDSAGVDRVINTDDIGGVHTERAKLGWGADGTYNDVSAATPMPVTSPPVAEGTGTLASVNGAVTVAVPDGARTAHISLGTGTWTNDSTVLQFQVSFDGGSTYRVVPVGGKNSMYPNSMATVSDWGNYTFGQRDFVGEVAGASHCRVIMTDRTGSDSIPVRVRLSPADTIYKINVAPPPQPVSVASTTAVWANSAGQNTEKLTNLTLPSTQFNPGRLLAVFVRNPSTVTALTAKVQHTWSDPVGGTTRYADLSNPAGLSTFTVALNNADGQVFLVDGGLLAGGTTAARLSLKNITALGGSDGFTASVRVLALCS